MSTVLTVVNGETETYAVDVTTPLATGETVADAGPPTVWRQTTDRVEEDVSLDFTVQDTGIDGDDFTFALSPTDVVPGRYVIRIPIDTSSGRSLVRRLDLRVFGAGEGAS